mgnify:CR=1 FL=1
MSTESSLKATDDKSSKDDKEEDDDNAPKQNKSVKENKRKRLRVSNKGNKSKKNVSI